MLVVCDCWVNMGLDLVIEPVRLQIFEIEGMWLLVMPYEWPLRSTLTTSCIDPDVTPELALQMTLCLVNAFPHLCCTPDAMW